MEQKFFNLPTKARYSGELVELELRIKEKFSAHKFHRTCGLLLQDIYKSLLIKLDSFSRRGRDSNAAAAPQIDHISFSNFNNIYFFRTVTSALEGITYIK